MKVTFNKDAFRSESFDISAMAKATDFSKLSGKAKDVNLKPEATGGSEGIVLDAHAWLPAASKIYNISPDLKDYVMVPIPAMVTGIPNTNGDSATLEEMLRFDPKMGMQAYKTFKAKPTHLEHANKDYTIAKGVILDSYLQPLPQFRGNHAKLVLLLAFDRTRDPELCNRIISGDLNTYSIGMYFNSYRCSVCGHVAHQDSMRVCSHTRPRKPTYMLGNKLVYRECQTITGFECSAVEDPAFVSAHSNGNQIMYV